MNPVLLALLVAPTLPARIEGTSACPRPAEVAQRLAALLPAARSTEPPTIARVDAAPAGVRVALRRPDGAALGERLLPAGPSCAELAAQAALAIAAWYGDAHAELGLPLPPPEPPAAGAAPPTATAARAGSAATPARRDGSAATAPPPAIAAAPGAHGPAAFDLGAGVLASGSGSWAPGVTAVATWTPAGRGLGATAFGFWESRRSLPLGDGTVHWSRGALGAGAHHRARISHWFLLEARAGLAVAVSRLEGTGFAVNRRPAGASPGASAALRLLLGRAERPTWLAGWVEVQATAWLFRERARTEPSGAQRSLPRSALLVSLGASLGRIR